jgi:hypothetical protein
MSDPGAAEEWEVVVPDDGSELLAELRRHGVCPGQRLRVRTAAVSGSFREAQTVGRGFATGGGGGRGDDAGATPDGEPEFIGSFDSGQRFQ